MNAVPENTTIVFNIFDKEGKHYFCNECRKEIDRLEDYDYCPWCGRRITFSEASKPLISGEQLDNYAALYDLKREEGENDVDLKNRILKLITSMAR